MLKVVEGVLVEKFNTATFLGAPMSAGIELAGEDIGTFFQEYVGRKVSITIKVLDI